MTILIIEDELASASRLKRLILDYDPGCRILAILETVEDAVRWFEASPPPDLIFMDIQLADGLSFEIFDQTEVVAPVVFTTAFDEFALEAFRVSSIDYLLKPIERQALERAFLKYSRLEAGFLARQNEKIRAVKLKSESGTGRYKSRFLVRSGKSSVSLPADQIAGAEIHLQVVFLISFDGKRYLTGYTLDELEQVLSPEEFFRINRQHLVHISAIRKLEPYFNSRLSLTLTAGFQIPAIVAREKAAAFRKWLDR